MATQYLPSSGTIGLGQARDQWNQPGPEGTSAI